MKTIRMSPRLAGLTVALLVTSGLGLLGVRVLAQDDERRPRAREVLRQALKEKLDGKGAQVILVEVRIAPGEGGKPHRHPGPVVGYVLEGAVEIQIDDGPLRTYHKGESFYEPARALHKVSRNASPTEPARFLAYMLTGEDERQLVLPAE
jgi:quercetin dioxygenase-like cupin family protein